MDAITYRSLDRLLPLLPRSFDRERDLVRDRPRPNPPPLWRLSTSSASENLLRLSLTLLTLSSAS